MNLAEIQTAISQLPHQDVERLRDWIELLHEDSLELSPEAEARIRESKREIAEGKFTVRRP